MSKEHKIKTVDSLQENPALVAEEEAILEDELSEPLTETYDPKHDIDMIDENAILAQQVEHGALGDTAPKDTEELGIHLEE
jgi:hypothetical protein